MLSLRWKLGLYDARGKEGYPLSLAGVWLVEHMIYLACFFRLTVSSYNGGILRFQFIG